MSKNCLQGKVALITGASRGIGAEVAKHLAREGAHVIIAARNISDLEKVDDEIQASGGMATIVQLDLTDYTKIDVLALSIAERFGKLDILVGNAAILGVLSPITHLTVDVWQRVMDTNLTANWRLIRAMDPLLRKSDAAKAMFVTCDIARTCDAYWGVYSASKAGLEALLKTYANEIRHTNVKVSLCSPGSVATYLRQEAMPGEDQSTLQTAREAAVKIAEFAF